MKISDISVEYVDHMGSDLSVVNAARVSFAKESGWIELQREIDGVQHPITKVLSEGDRKLITYLAKHKHYSPFNHTFITLRIKAPIFVARQLVKHEYMPWNEVSRRYVDSEPEFYVPELRKRGENMKQGSLDEVVPVEPMSLQTDLGHLTITPEGVVQTCLDLYNHLLSQGVAPEVARNFLPHTLMTEWIWSGTLKAFHKMLDLRLAAYTQKESRIVAEKASIIVEDLFPVSFPALMKN